MTPLRGMTRCADGLACGFADSLGRHDNDVAGASRLLVIRRSRVIAVRSARSFVIGSAIQ